MPDPTPSMPPLPEPFIGVQNNPWGGHSEVVRCAIGEPGVISVYTADQMHAYAQAVADARVREATAHLSQDDVNVLVGQAIVMRGDGLQDMPAFFFDLAARLSLALGDAAAADRIRSLAGKEGP